MGNLGRHSSNRLSIGINNMPSRSLNRNRGGLHDSLEEETGSFALLLFAFVGFFGLVGFFSGEESPTSAPINIRSTSSAPSPRRLPKGTIRVKPELRLL